MAGSARRPQPLAVRAGADVLVMGSAIFGHPEGIARCHRPERRQAEQKRPAASGWPQPGITIRRRQFGLVHGPQAARADAHLAGSAIHDQSHLLDVWRPLTIRRRLGVAHVVPELRAFAAYFTARHHLPPSHRALQPVICLQADGIVPSSSYVCKLVTRSVAMTPDSVLGKIEVSPRAIASLASEAVLRCYGVVGMVAAHRCAMASPRFCRWRIAIAASRSRLSDGQVADRPVCCHRVRHPHLRGCPEHHGERQVRCRKGPGHARGRGQRACAGRAGECR